MAPDMMDPCTQCGGLILNQNDMRKHPTLNVPQCLPCHVTYNQVGDLSRYRGGVDLNGQDNYCRWCLDGGELILCADENCRNGFCRNCIIRNKGDKGCKEIEDSDSWYCFVCEPLNQPQADPKPHLDTPTQGSEITKAPETHASGDQVTSDARVQPTTKIDTLPGMGTQKDSEIQKDSQFQKDSEIQKDSQFQQDSEIQKDSQFQKDSEIQKDSETNDTLTQNSEIAKAPEKHATNDRIISDTREQPTTPIVTLPDMDTQKDSKFQKDSEIQQDSETNDTQDLEIVETPETHTTDDQIISDTIVQPTTAEKPSPARDVAVKDTKNSKDCPKTHVEAPKSSYDTFDEATSPGGPKPQAKRKPPLSFAIFSTSRLCSKPREAPQPAEPVPSVKLSQMSTTSAPQTMEIDDPKDRYKDLENDLVISDSDDDSDVYMEAMSTGMDIQNYNEANDTLTQDLEIVKALETHTTEGQIISDARVQPTIAGKPNPALNWAMRDAKTLKDRLETHIEALKSSYDTFDEARFRGDPMSLFSWTKNLESFLNHSGHISDRCVHLYNYMPYMENGK